MFKTKFFSFYLFLLLRLNMAISVPFKLEIKVSSCSFYLIVYATPRAPIGQKSSRRFSMINYQ